MTARPEDLHIGLVVEGAGDRGAVPVLLRLHRNLLGDYRDIFGKPIPCNGRGSATVDGGIEGYVVTAANRPGCRGVLVVLDGESDSVCRLGPDLLERAESVCKVPVVVCLAEKSFEDWIMASAETLRIGLAYEENAKAVTAIKQALSPIKYTKPVWQPKLASRMDPDLASSRSPSLARTFDKFDQLVGQLA